VTVDGSGDVPTIQAAIDTAAIGDTILVGPGHYKWSNQGTGDDRGFIRFYTRFHNAALMSEMGPEVTTLDAEYQSRVIYCHAMNEVTIEGFTITRGEAPAWGDYCGGGFFTHIPYHDRVRNCIFTHNRGRFGGGLSCVINDNTDFAVENCTFVNNESTNYGGAIGLANGNGLLHVTDCVIRDNYAASDGGGIFTHHCNPVITDCVITGNQTDGQGSALAVHTDVFLTVVGCTICRNSSDGAVINTRYNNTVSFSTTIFAFNTGRLFEIDSTTTGEIGCCDIFGNSGGDAIPDGLVDNGHHIFLDPLFCGTPVSGNYYLRSDSPCLPSNHPYPFVCQQIGALPRGCGAVGTEEASWGDLKKIFKSNRNQ
jgi:hypothetical protein